MVADETYRLSLTPPQEAKKKKANAKMSIRYHKVPSVEDGRLLILATAVSRIVSVFSVIIFAPAINEMDSGVGPLVLT
jgi:hypothetical protein